MDAERFALAAAEQLRAILIEDKLCLVPPYVAVRDMAVVVATPSQFRKQHPVSLEAIGSGSFVQVCPSLGYRSLWVRTENDGYREDYAAFLAARGLAIPPGYHVDHILNRARGLDAGFVYLRTALVPDYANMSHGAGYEKARTEGALGRGKESRTVEFVNFLKLLGEHSPPKSGKVTPRLRRAIARLADALGEPPSEVEIGVANLMAAARFRPPA